MQPENVRLTKYVTLKLDLLNLFDLLFTFSHKHNVLLFRLNLRNAAFVYVIRTKYAYCSPSSSQWPPFLNETSAFIVTVSQCQVKRETDSGVIDRGQKEKTVAAITSSLAECIINNFTPRP